MTDTYHLISNIIPVVFRVPVFAYVEVVSHASGANFEIDCLMIAVRLVSDNQC